jgi:hypothetical protein
VDTFTLQLQAEFEKRLEADLGTVFNTLVALFAVVSYWRGIWALLDNLFGDSVAGDLACVLMGLVSRVRDFINMPVSCACAMT